MTVSRATDDRSSPVRTESNPDTHVGTIVLDRGPHNFINADTLTAVVRGARELQAGHARAIVLRAEGRNFCAGADLKDGQDPNDPGQRHIYDVAVELFEIEIPIVAAIHGKLVGAGVGLAVGADLRVAAPDTTLHANFTRLGFTHGFGLTVTLPRLIGESRAAELLLTGRPVVASQALAMGLVDRVSEDADPTTAATRLAEQVAANAPLAVRSARKLLRGGLAGDVAHILRDERAAQEQLMTTADFREGVRASAERREPRFEGR
jgi:2-(1,2-epoxy-1,2-dihydrophenyl)acetyl-CoA isomerase